jgi:hypothetical protein
MADLLNRAFLVATFMLQVLVLRLIVKRGLQTRFRWFLIYIVYGLVESAVRLYVSGDVYIYKWTYWWTEIGEGVLTVLAFRESFLNVFRAQTRLRWFTPILWSGIGLALLYALLRAWIFRPAGFPVRGAVIVGLEVGVNYSLTAAAILYFLMMWMLNAKGFARETGVILGFTIYTALGIMSLLLDSYSKVQFLIFGRWIAPVIYVVAELEWLVTFVRKEEQVRVPFRDLTIDDLGKLGDYIRVLSHLLGRKA